MTVRRLLVAAVVFTWLLPAAMAGAIALHVAFEHAGDHDHEATHGLVDSMALAEYPHLASPAELPHDHSAVVVVAYLPARHTIASSTHENPCGAVLPPWLGVDLEELAVRSRARPPRTSGPPLLAQLSTLRI